MRSREVARRYAEALFEIAQETHSVASLETELEEVVESTATHPEISKFLAHPLVPRGAKRDLLLLAFPEVSQTLASFLTLVIRNRRESYLDLIRSEFRDVRTQAEGIVRVRLVAAQAMTDEQRDRFVSKLESVLDRPVELEEAVDEQLLGGARIEAEGQVLDGTMKSRLASLRAQLES